VKKLEKISQTMLKKNFLFFTRVTTLLALTITNFIFAISSSLFLPTLITLFIALFILEPTSHYVQIVVFIPMLGLFFIYNAYGSQASNTDWPLRLSDTLAHTSSCTKNTQSTLPFNAASQVDYLSTEELNNPMAYCPFPHLKWADATNEDFNGTDLEGVFLPNNIKGPFATNRVSDYLQNLGRGLSHGYFPKAFVADTSLCPNVDRRITDKNAIGVGRPICTTCTWAFARKTNTPVFDCKDSNNDAFCFLCPGYLKSESNNYVVLRQADEIILFWLVFIVFFSFLSFMCNCVEKKKKGP
jgi:hypothetical protein